MSYRRKHIKPKIKRLKRRKKLIKRPWFWIVLAVLVISGILFYFMLFFSKFQVKNIEISGNEKINKGDIEDLTWLNINKKLLNNGLINISTKSIFIVNSKKVIKGILAEFPAIEEVKLQKKLPRNIVLKIRERQPFSAFCSDYVGNARSSINQDQITEECFVLDINGVIFDELQSIPQNMTVIKEKLNGKAFLGQNIIEKNIIGIIYNVEKNLKDNFQIGVKEVLISDPLIFKTSENWEIYFDPKSDINLQITKMNILLKDEIPESVRKNMQYIYLQYKDRAYYK